MQLDVWRLKLRKKSSIWRVFLEFALFCQRIMKVSSFWPAKKCNFQQKNVQFPGKMDTEWPRIGWKQLIRTFRWLFISLSRQKGHNTWCSQSFSHPSTNQSLRCLTSVTGQEPVHSTWFGRSHWRLKESLFCFWHYSFLKQRFTHLSMFSHFFRCILVMVFPTWDYLIRVQTIGQQTTFAVCSQKKLIDSVGILTSLIGLAQQLG